MHYFQYQNHQLLAEQASLSAIAKQYGTPCYVYSQTALENNWQNFEDAFKNYPHRICYAVKANSNLAILNILAKKNSGFDIVSLGELERVLAAGGDPQKIVFSGVGKKSDEIIRALQIGIYCFNVESASELERLQEIAQQQNLMAPISLRINPNIDARTHPYIATGLRENKFGIAYEEALPLLKNLTQKPNVKLLGIACHIGSQLTELSPFIDAMERISHLVEQLEAENIVLQHVNIGGGLGVCYQDETPPSIAEYVKVIHEKLSSHNLEIIIEPGRAIVANAGILLTKIEYIKKTQHKNFLIVDAAMNDLMRPALYDAWHNILPVEENQNVQPHLYDIAGPVCESADFLGKNRQLAVAVGDLLAVFSAGAYGFSMSSNYNSRPRAAEVLVKDKQAHLIRERETINDLFAKEKIK